MKPLDFAEGQRFIEALGKPPGTVRLRAFLHKEHPDKAGDLGRKGGMSRSLVTQWQAEGRGVYVVVVADLLDELFVGGCHARSVSDLPHFVK